MKKILYVQDALNYNAVNTEFIDFIYGLTGCRISAFFFEDKETVRKLSIQQADWEGISDLKATAVTQLREICNENVRRFTTACHVRDIPYSISRMSRQLDGIVQESRYADLLLLDVGDYDDTVPGDFARELLCYVECPVIIMPLTFLGVEELVFTYDGRESSSYAIKQFTYLLPLLGNYKAVVVCINPGMIDEAEWNKFREWIVGCYARIEFLYAEGNVAEELFEILRKRDHPFIVMGAYGSGLVSELLNPSQADPVIQLTSHAIFIAHQ